MKMPKRGRRHGKWWSVYRIPQIKMKLGQTTHKPRSEETCLVVIP